MWTKKKKLATIYEMNIFSVHIDFCFLSNKISSLRKKQFKKNAHYEVKLCSG